MPDNRYVLEVDPSSALAAFKEMQKAQKLMETDAVAGAKNMSSAMEDFSKRMVTFRNRENQAQERNIKNLERQADLYGRSGIEKLSAQRDNLIRNLQREGDQYGKLEERINRVRAAYQKMIDTENQRNPSSSNQSGLLALRGLRDLFEGRTAYGEVQMGKSLMGLSGGAFVLGGTVAAIAGLGAAAASSYKSLAELGTQIHDVQLRTGFTAKEVTQFSFAAKAAGQDVSIFERTMRGLTQAVEDQSAQGERGREWLVRFGVDIRGLREGTASTADTFTQIAHGLSQITSPLERNKAELDLFKRAGIEAIPVIQQLEENLKVAKEHGWGPDETEVARFVSYQRNLAIVSETWGDIWRNIKEATVASAAFLLSWPTQPNQQFHLVNGRLTPGPGGGGNGPPPVPSLSDLSSLSRRITGDDAVRAYQQNLGTDWKLKEAERALGKLPAPEIGVSTPDEVRAYQAAQRRVEDLRAANSAAKSAPGIMERLQKQRDEARAAADAATDIRPSTRAYTALQVELATQSDNMAKIRREQPGNAKALQDVRDTNTFNEYTKRQQYLHALSVEGAEDTRKAEQNQSALERVLKEIAPKSPILTKEQSEEWRAASQIRQINDERDRYGLTSAAAHTMQMSQIGAAGGGYGEQQSAITNATQQRLTLAKQIGDLERKQADDALRETGNESQHRVDMVRAQYNEEKEIIQTRLEGEEKIAELRKKEIDDVKKQIEGLMDTLLTHPSHFGSALAKYAKGQLIHGISGPISGGLAQMIVGGGGGGGGMGGSGGGGIGSGIFGRIFGGGGGSAGGSYSIPTNYSATQSDADRVAFGVGVGLGNGFGIYGDGGIPDLVGTRGEIDPRYSPGRDDAGPGPTGAGGYGGSSSHSTMPSAGGLTGLFKGGLGSMGLFNHRIGSRTAVYDNTGQPVGGPANANYAKMQAAGNQALFTGGTALATSSLTGNYRGTALGTLGGAVGGAAAGFGIAGPIGAAVGGAVGLGIGLGEQIAGVQSDRTKAINAVKQTYHISISNTMADQIASLAQSKYGDNVNTAVHSPEVRQMLGVYAAGTGQRDKFPLSANTPYGAGAVESGGRLFQNPTYQYGSPETYKSNLPVYGGNPGGTIPYQTGSGPTYLSMNVNGSGMSQFMTGEVVTPSFVQGQTTAAWAGSNGRTDNSMVLQEPGSLVG